MNKKRLIYLFEKHPKEVAFYVTADGLTFHSNDAKAADKHAALVGGEVVTISREQAEQWHNDFTAAELKAVKQGVEVVVNADDSTEVVNIDRERLAHLFGKHKDEKAFHVTTDGLSFHSKDKAAADKHVSQVGGTVKTVTREEAAAWQKEVKAVEVEAPGAGSGEAIQLNNDGTPPVIKKEDTPAPVEKMKIADMTAKDMKLELTELGVSFKGNASTADLQKLLKANRK